MNYNPNPPRKPSPRVAALLRRCNRLSYLKVHPEKWRNKVAEQLNEILGRVQWTLETGGDEVDIMFAKAALNIVERVANFEEIKRR